MLWVILKSRPNVFCSVLIKTVVHIAKICSLNWTRKQAWERDTVLLAVEVWKINLGASEMDALRDDLTLCGMIPKPRNSTKEKGSAQITPTTGEQGWRSPDDDSLQSGLDQLPQFTKSAWILKLDTKWRSTHTIKQPQRETKEQTLNTASAGGKCGKSSEKSSRKINLENSRRLMNILHQNSHQPPRDVHRMKLYNEP